MADQLAGQKNAVRVPLIVILADDLDRHARANHSKWRVDTVTTRRIYIAIDANVPDNERWQLDTAIVDINEDKLRVIDSLNARHYRELANPDSCGWLIETLDKWADSVNPAP